MSEWREQPRTVRIWWLFVLRGVFAAALGIFALIWPTVTLEILILFVGVYLIADGVMGLVVALRRGASSGRLFQPAISVVIGLIVVLWPSQSARTLFMVLGAGALFLGVSYVITARRYAVDAMDRQLTTSAGIVAAVLGVILMIWPGVAVVTLSWMIAAVALLTGAVLIFLGMRFKQMQMRVQVVIPPE